MTHTAVKDTLDHQEEKKATKNVFVVYEGIAIPDRQSFPRGPRGSMYPLETMIEGQSFDIPVKNEKEAAQKRSYLSALGKSRGIKAVTRYLKEEGIVRAWHGGLREGFEQSELDLGGE